MSPRLAVVVGLFALGALVIAQEPKKDEPKKEPEKKQYKGNDMSRPRPKVVDPGTTTPGETPGKPPADALVLFGGTSLKEEWVRGGKDATEPTWKIENGYAEVKGGGIQTKKKFGDSQIHIEWATPKEVKGNGQGRGNSGIFLSGYGEIQVLDSHNNDTYPDGQAGALYGRLPPLVNASRKPGEWQVFDIIAELPKIDGAGKVTRPGRITVLHNGVAVHHAVDSGGRQTEFGISIQDHGNPVRYRNIWVRKLGQYDDGTPAPEPKKK